MTFNGCSLNNLARINSLFAHCAFSFFLLILFVWYFFSQGLVNVKERNKTNYLLFYAFRSKGSSAVVWVPKRTLFFVALNTSFTMRVTPHIILYGGAVERTEGWLFSFWEKKSFLTVFLKKKSFAHFSRKKVFCWF